MTAPSFLSNHLGSNISTLSNQFGSKLSLISAQFGSQMDLVKDKINQVKKSKSLKSINNFSMKSGGCLVTDEIGIRQVVGCLLIDPISKRFLFININNFNWIIPEGNWDNTMRKQKQVAMCETWELAGVKGTITRLIGVFAEKSPTGVKAHHYIYELQIREVKQKFPGKNNCQRRWMTYNEAMFMVKSPFIQDALSLSSLSPLVHFYGQPLGFGKKKNKKNKKKLDYNYYDDNDDNDDNDDGDDDVEDIDEKTVKDKNKKKNKKMTNGDDDDNKEEETNKVLLNDHPSELVQISDPMINITQNNKVKSDKLR